MFGCHVTSFIPVWLLFWFCLFGFWFPFPLPPGKVNNLIKVDPSSGLALVPDNSSLHYNVCEEVSFGAIGLQSNAERFDLLD